MSYLLDTCVISELVARRPNAKVVAWVDALDDAQLYLSVITIGEIARGVEKLIPSPRRDLLATWLRDDLPARFAGRVLVLDAAVMLRWARLMATLERRGRSLPAMDSLIAALALHHSLKLVTRNVDDFAGADVEIVNPWEL